MGDTLCHILNNAMTGKSIFTFSNILIQTNSFIIKSRTISFIMLTVMMENKHKLFIEIAIIFA